MVETLTYQEKQQGKSVGDQARLYRVRWRALGGSWGQLYR